MLPYHEQANYFASYFDSVFRELLFNYWIVHVFKIDYPGYSNWQYKTLTNDEKEHPLKKYFQQIQQKPFK